MTDAEVVLSALDRTTAGRRYRRALDPNGLLGRRIGVWQVGRRQEVDRVFEDSIAAMAARGSTIVGGLTFGIDEEASGGFAAIMVELKHRLNARLGLPGPHPRVSRS